MKFLIDNWMLISVALASGGMLMWPMLTGGGGAAGVNPADAVMLMNREKAVVIDVGEPHEFAAGHVGGSKNIPFGQLEEKLPGLVKNKALPVILVCPLGARAGRAVAVAKKMGYEQAQSLGGAQARGTLRQRGAVGIGLLLQAVQHGIAIHRPPGGRQGGGGLGLCGPPDALGLGRGLLLVGRRDVHTGTLVGWRLRTARQPQAAGQHHRPGGSARKSGRNGHPSFPCKTTGAAGVAPACLRRRPTARSTRVRSRSSATYITGVV